MSAVCIACYVTLLFIAIHFIRLRTTLVRLFIGLMIFEVAYFFTIPFLCTSPGFGISVAAASGAANGGLMFQFIPLFPIWGPLLARWAKNRMEISPSGNDELFFASEQVNRPSDWILAFLNFVVMFALVSVLARMAWQQIKGTSFPPPSVSFGIPVLISLVNAHASVKGRRTRRRRKIEQRHVARLQKGLCPRCEYDLTGLPANRCPECGFQIAAEMKTDTKKGITNEEQQTGTTNGGTANGTG